MEQRASMGAQDPLLNDNGCDSQARVRVCVRPLHAAQYVDAELCSSALFDVILQLAEPPENSSSASTSAQSSPLLHIQRCLHDFAQLERELQQEAKSNDDGGSVAAAALPAITPAIKAYLASRGKDDATVTQLYGRDGDALLFEARFAWQLELFVSSLIAHSDPQVSCSRALKRFISGGDLAVSPVTKHEVDYEGSIETLFVGTTSAAVHERILSGCTVEHATRVYVTQNSADDESEGIEASANQQAMVLWRFASQGEHVVFSTRFTEKHQLQHHEQVECDDDASEADPYSPADPYKACEGADPWSGGGDEPSEVVHNSILDGEDSPMEQYMAQYRTWCSFAPAAQDETTSPQYVYGAFLAKTSGELVLEWENADTTSVFSKPLEFQVCVVPLLQEREDAGVDGVLRTLLIGGGEAQQHQRDDASWVHEVIMASKVTSLEHILDQRDDDDNDDADDYLSNPEEIPHSGSGGGDLGRDTKEQLARLQEEKHFHEQRAKEFEERVSQLEEALFATKKELQKAHDDIAISEEIYKASLEAITQLEVAASVSQQKPLATTASVVAIPPLLPPLSSPDIAEDTAEEDRGAAASSSSSSVTEKEHQRVVNLCTTFQEQCLWRSIELAESEKRNMALEGKLQNTEQEKSELQGQIAAQEEQINLLQAENKKLRTHKSILVQEVKKLQPYSQINLAALVQEAQEARMMQRSLQAQLDSRNASEIVVSTATSSSVAAEEDGAGGGFVVIESEDHSSP